MEGKEDDKKKKTPSKGQGRGVSPHELDSGIPRSHPTRLPPPGHVEGTRSLISEDSLSVWRWKSPPATSTSTSTEALQVGPLSASDLIQNNPAVITTPPKSSIPPDFFETSRKWTPVQVRDLVQSKADRLKSYFDEAINLAGFSIKDGMSTADRYEDTVMECLSYIQNMATTAPHRFVSEIVFFSYIEDLYTGSVSLLWCPICRLQRGFNNRNAFRNHYIDVHSLYDRTYSCPEQNCPFAPARFCGYVIRHLRSAHNRRPRTGELQGTLGMNNPLPILGYRDGRIQNQCNLIRTGRVLKRSVFPVSVPRNSRHGIEMDLKNNIPVGNVPRDAFVLLRDDTSDRPLLQWPDIGYIEEDPPVDEDEEDDDDGDEGGVTATTSPPQSPAKTRRGGKFQGQGDGKATVKGRGKKRPATKPLKPTATKKSKK